MKHGITYIGLPAAILSVSLFAACQNTARGIEQDAENNAAAAREEAREAGNAADRAADNAVEATKSAAEATKDAAVRVADATTDAAGRVVDASKDAGQSAGATVDAAQQTLQIKTALIDADNIDAGGINVDTDAATKTVTLKGHVPTAAQKAAAERVAKDKAPSYRVVNDLVVRS